MAEPDRDRNINRLTWIAFILAALVGLLSIIFVRPVPALDVPSTEIASTEIARIR